VVKKGRARPLERQTCGGQIVAAEQHHRLQEYGGRLDIVDTRCRSPGLLGALPARSPVASHVGQSAVRGQRQREVGPVADHAVNCDCLSTDRDEPICHPPAEVEHCECQQPACAQDGRFRVGGQHGLQPLATLGEQAARQPITPQCDREP
jgi:hypothetical protein